MDIRWIVYSGPTGFFPVDASVTSYIPIRRGYRCNIRVEPVTLAKFT